MVVFLVEAEIHSEEFLALETQGGTLEEVKGVTLWPVYWVKQTTLSTPF